MYYLSAKFGDDMSSGFCVLVLCIVWSQYKCLMMMMMMMRRESRAGNRLHAA